jgi:hypothetical protein
MQLMPPGKFFTMFHFLEYPFSRGSTHITSPNPYDAPDFDAGFMNDKRDMAPMVWGYIKSRETARRMNAYAGEVQNMHPFYAYDSPARAKDMDLATTNAVSASDMYILPGAQLMRRSMLFLETSPQAFSTDPGACQSIRASLLSPAS